MKRLMLILIMLVIAISSYSDSISGWWDSLTRDEKIEVLQEYIRIINAGENEILFDGIEYAVDIKGSDIILTPVYPDGSNCYILSIADILEYAITLDPITIKDAIPPPPDFWDYAIPCAITGIITFFVGYLLK